MPTKVIVLGGDGFHGLAMRDRFENIAWNVEDYEELNHSKILRKTFIKDGKD